MLIAVDGGRELDVELPVATMLARWTGADVRLAHVASGRRDGERLARVAAGLRETSALGVAFTVDWGDVAERLSAIAAHQDAGVVVMRVRHRRNVSRVLLGSITARLLRESPVPLVLVPASGPALGGRIRRAGAARANVSADHDSRTVVVALDGTPGAERAAASVATLAESVGVRVVLALVAVPSSRGSRARDGVARIAALRGRLMHRGWDVCTDAVIASDDVEAIAVAARDHGASIVALTCGARGILAPHDALRLCDRLGRAGGPPVWAVTERSPPRAQG